MWKTKKAGGDMQRTEVENNRGIRWAITTREALGFPSPLSQLGDQIVPIPHRSSMVKRQE